jgi:acetolactate synthase small subunit|tara:strand:- start:463 stop:2073 length:1611 start_codon:yes stop_codon:yes gene_type:complete
MPEETLLSKLLSGLKRKGKKSRKRKQKIRLPFSGKIKTIASNLMNSKIPEMEKLSPEGHQINKPSFGIVAKDKPEYVSPAVKFNGKKLNKTLQKNKIFSKAFSRLEIMMKKLNESGKRFIPISRNDVTILTKIIPAYRTGGMVMNPTPAVLGEGGPESVHEQNMRFLEAQGARTREFAERQGMETYGMVRERDQRMFESGLSDNEKVQRRLIESGKFGQYAHMFTEPKEKKPKTEAQKKENEIRRKEKRIETLTRRVPQLQKQLEKILNNPRVNKTTKERQVAHLRKRIKETELDLQKLVGGSTTGYNLSKEEKEKFADAAMNRGQRAPIEQPTDENTHGLDPMELEAVMTANRLRGQRAPIEQPTDENMHSLNPEELSAVMTASVNRGRRPVDPSIKPYDASFTPRDTPPARSVESLFRDNSPGPAPTPRYDSSGIPQVSTRGVENLSGAGVNLGENLVERTNVTEKQIEKREMMMAQAQANQSQQVPIPINLGRNIMKGNKPTGSANISAGSDDTFTRISKENMRLPIWRTRMG